MKLDRTKNAFNMVLFGTINNIVWIVFPFFLRTCVIYYLGEEYLGVSSLFTSILSVLSLAELGFGSAVAVSMYKPVAKDDTAAICALMKLYRKIYYIVGSVVLVLGLALLPFLNALISGDYPADLNIYVIYVLYLLSTVSTYFLFAYRQVLLTVHQRQDVVQKVSIATKIITCILQAIVLICFKNMYCYVALNVVNSIVVNLVCAKSASKKYPMYQCEGDVSDETLHQIYKKVSGLFIQKIGVMLSTQLDSIVVSAFLGLVLLARYSNYLYIAGAVGALLITFFSSLVAGIGNCMALESKQKVYALFLKIQFIASWMVGWCAICLLVMYQPFMQLWVGADMMLGDATVCCLVVYFYVQYNKYVVPTFKDAAGLWWEDKWKPLVAGLTNVIINIVLVQTIGVNGVIISTILSYLCIEMPWETYILYKHYFKRSVAEYYKKHLAYIAVALLAGGSTCWLVSYLPSTGLIAFVLKGCACVVVPNLVFVAAYHKNPAFKEALQMGKQMLKRK